MAKIIGNITTTPYPRPDWNQTNETKADYIKNKPDIAALESSIMSKIDELECGVYGDIVLKDKSNDKTYGVYVLGGDLKIEEISSAPPCTTIVFRDLITEVNYAVYVSDGLLKKHETLDEYTHKTIVLKDKKSNKTYMVFVSDSKLTMAEGDSIVSEHEMRINNLENLMEDIDSALGVIEKMQSDLIGDGKV